MERRCPEPAPSAQLAVVSCFLREIAVTGTPSEIIVGKFKGSFRLAYKIDNGDNTPL